MNIFYRNRSWIVWMCLLMAGAGFNATAQTADNSIKISGGQFGSGVNFVFAHIDKYSDQAFYRAWKEKDQTSVGLTSVHLIYKGKEIQLMVLISLKDGTSAGTYTMNPQPSQHPTPNALVSFHVAADDGIPGHVIVSQSGNVIVTALGGPGNYVIGSFSGQFFEIVNDHKVIYQLSGHFKGYRSLYQ